MSKQEIVNQYQESVKVKQILKQIQLDKNQIQITNLVGSLMSFVISETFKKDDKSYLLILNDKEEAAYHLNDLEQLLDQKNVLFYPGSYRRPYQIEETDNANVLMRSEVLNRINSRKKPTIIVTYPEALFEKVVTKKDLERNTLKLSVSESVSLDFVNEILFEYNFNRVDFVTEPGDFSVRGGIIDVFSFSNDVPFRIEFFGDEIDSIRTFDVETQLSKEKLRKASIMSNVENKTLQEKRESFLQYIASNTVIFLKNKDLLIGKLDKLFDRAESAFSELSKELNHARPIDLFCNGNFIQNQLSDFRVASFETYTSGDKPIIDFITKAQPSFNKQFDLLIENLNEYHTKGFTNYIFCANEQQAQRFQDIFEDAKKEVHYQTIVFPLYQGFIDFEEKIVCYTDHQIFERYHKFRLKNGFAKKQSITLKELNNLDVGDYVTHIDHGIGKFGGLQKIDVEGKNQEAIKLIYGDRDILYVSIHSLHKISKFNGKDGKAPKIYKLGSGAWKKIKQKTKKRVKEIAYNLIKLYAKRRMEKGLAFGPDTHIQHELEASFIYEDTPDQYTATQDVKADMEKEQPMDRLVCGDVGFGKTEIAIRAAFKAVDNGKQVAILVPTTILAFQHYKTFTKRLEKFPVRIDYLNRFRTSKQRNEAIEGVNDGSIDIIIGTHQLTNKKIKFKDLGLLIIDEEQKFGVAVKDKLKTMRTSVDTLTLTATPIPRTLQFSLMGARDLSIINTPPPNRQPVLTEIISLNEETIRDAISYEVSRGGQVFFVNNRIANIQEIAGMIQRLCPGVRVGIGHGQMDGKVLEQNMLNFIKGAYDVLIATTIIESGIDISNANTIIINNANNFGLSDLHQLRGRVGRSNKKAFCYLIAPKFSLLSSEARKRLEALVQFTDLGSGFNIAMKDLDIRGAGNMLGGEQSGFISEIGFEMYQKILNEAMKELRNDEFKDLFNERTTDQMGSYSEDCIFETDYEVRIPDHYVNDVTERLSLYQELDHIESMEKLLEFEARMKDRFGTIPKEVKELFFSFELRWLAQKLGLERLVIKSEKMVGWFIADPTSSFYQTDVFSELLKKIMNMGQGYRLIQKQDKLRLVVEPISNIREAYQKLNALYEEKEAIESTDT